MKTNIRISNIYPLREGNRKSDGAPYAVREIEVYIHKLDGSYPDYLLVRLSGDMAREADGWDRNKVYEAELALSVDERPGKDGQLWRKQSVWMKSMTPVEAPEDEQPF